MVIAQDRPTSQDFSMPETAIGTGDVDFILPPFFCLPLRFGSGRLRCAMPNRAEPEGEKGGEVGLHPIAEGQTDG